MIPLGIRVSNSHMENTDSAAQTQLQFVMKTMDGNVTFVAVLWRILLLLWILYEPILEHQVIQVSQKL